MAITAAAAPAYRPYNRPRMFQSLFDFLASVSPPITLIAGIVLLLLGGNWLVDGSVSIARRIGWSTLLIGLTIVAFGTSSPELAFNLTAAINGNGGLSFGNVVGSNIANIALVLGLAALVSPLVVHGQVVKKELPLLIIVSCLMVLLAWLPATRIQGDEGAAAGFTRIDGLMMLGGFAIFTWLWYRMGKQDRSDPMTAEAEQEAREEGPASLGVAILLFVLGLVLLVVGGKLTEMGAVGIAEWWGFSQSLIGLTVVAVATSLPEVTTSMIACRKGHADLAVGNVVGSNLFNILLVLGATAAVAPVAVPADVEFLSLGRGWWDLFVMLGLTLVLLPIAMTNQRRIMKMEGVFFLVCYFGYMTLSVTREIGQ